MAGGPRVPRRGVLEEEAPPQEAQEEEEVPPGLQGIDRLGPHTDQEQAVRPSGAKVWMALFILLVVVVLVIGMYPSFSLRHRLKRYLQAI